MELAFPCGSSYQRKLVHQIAEKFGLTHYSTDSETRNVIVKKKDPNELQLSTTPPQHNYFVGSPSSFTTSSAQPINKQQQQQQQQQQQYQRKRGNTGNSISSDQNKHFNNSYDPNRVVAQTPPGLSITPTNINFHSSNSTKSSSFQNPSSFERRFTGTTGTGGGGGGTSPISTNNIIPSPSNYAASSSYGSSPTYRNSAAHLNRFTYSSTPQIFLN